MSEWILTLSLVASGIFGFFMVFFAWAFTKMSKRCYLVETRLKDTQEMLKLLADELIKSGEVVKKLKAAVLLLEQALIDQAGVGGTIEFIPDFKTPDDDDDKGGGTTH